MWYDSGNLGMLQDVKRTILSSGGMWFDFGNLGIFQDVKRTILSSGGMWYDLGNLRMCKNLLMWPWSGKMKCERKLQVKGKVKWFRKFRNV